MPLRPHRSLLYIYTVLVVSIACVPCPAADKPVSNAALKYWQAFSTMPKVEDELVQKLKSACQEDSFGNPIDQSLSGLVQRSEYALRMLHRGTVIKECDWGVDMRADGAETLLPHLVKARTLARLTLVRARMRFENGELNDGIGDILGAVAIARHISHDGTLIGWLVGCSVETTAGKVLAAYLPLMDQASLKAFSEQLNSLPSMNSAAAAIQSEELFVDWAVEQIEMEGDGRLLKLCETLTTSKQQTQELILAGGNHEQFIGHLDALRPLYVDGVKLLKLSSNEFAQEEKELAARLKKNPIAKFVFPDFGALYRANAARECHRSLLNAAIDVQANGKSTLRSHKDPYGDGAFEMIYDSATESAYRLRSRLKRDNGEFVQLSVGRSVQ